MEKPIALVSVNPLINIELKYVSVKSVPVVNSSLEDTETALAEGSPNAQFTGYVAADWTSYSALVSLGIGAPLSDHATLRSALSDSSVKQPRFVVLDETADVSQALQGLRLPLLVRKGLRERYVEYLEDVSLAVSQLGKMTPTQDRIVVEEMVDGTGYSVYTLISDDGLEVVGVVALEWTSRRGQFPVAMHCPAELSETLHGTLLHEAQAIASSLGDYRGFLRLDFVVQGDTAYIKTMDPCILSPWMPFDVLALSGVYPLWNNVLKYAAGGTTFASGEEMPQGAALRWVSARSGAVSAVTGVDAAAEVPGVVRVHIDVHPGDRLRHAVNMLQRDGIGYVVAKGASSLEAQAAVQHAVNTIHIETSTVIESTEFT